VTALGLSDAQVTWQVPLTATASTGSATQGAVDLPGEELRSGGVSIPASSGASVYCRRSHDQPCDRLATLEAQLGGNDLRLQSRIR
jgi:hypothetical protein